MGIAPPECFRSTTVATSGTVIPPCLTCQHWSNFKAAQPAHTGSKDDEDNEDNEEDEEDEEDDKECQDDEKDKDKTNSGQINEIQATVSIHGPTATHKTASKQPTASHDRASEQLTVSHDYTSQQLTVSHDHASQQHWVIKLIAWRLFTKAQDLPCIFQHYVQVLLLGEVSDHQYMHERA